MGSIVNNYIKPGARRLAGNTLWNLMGMCLPMTVALFAIPMLIGGLGNARFGLLGLVWMLVGYFSIFDLGIGRALTKMAAALLGRKAVPAGDMQKMFWTAMPLMLGLGIILGLLIALFSPLLAFRLLKTPETLQIEALHSFYIVAAGMPVVIMTTGLIGMLEAHQFFRHINFVRIPAGSFTFLGPLCVLPFSNSLPAVVGILIVGRLAETIAYLAICLYKIPVLRCRPTPCMYLIPPMAKFGGWLTVSNLAMPLMAHIDRFLIAALVSVTAVTYYITPAEIVIKLLIIPRALTSVLFPAFSAGAESAPEESAGLFGRGLRYLPGFLFPAALMIIILAPDGLRLWLGAEFSENSTSVMRWLAIGVFLNGLSYVPFSFIQGVGRPDITACLHAVELVVYVLVAPFFIRKYGITGAAAAWFVRAWIDLALMLWITSRLCPTSNADIKKLSICVVLCLLLAAAATLPETWVLRYSFGAAVLLLYPVFHWRFMLNTTERDTIINRAKKALSTKLKNSS